MTTHLPVVGSTAASTAFCSASIDGPGPDGSMLRLHFDGNGKITAGNGTLAEPRPNALSTRHVDDCPQSTATCRSVCYVENLKTARGDVYDLFRENSATMWVILADGEPGGLAEQWVFLVAAWIRENASAGFRWHVSGDVFSLEHAEWIADVVRESAPVRHWIYTRSFSFLAPLVAISTVKGGNLSVNLSCDRDNFTLALRAAGAWRSYEGAKLHQPPSSRASERLRLCYLVVEGDALPDDLNDDDVVFPDYSLRPRGHSSFEESPWWQSIEQRQRGLVCPADAVGKSEKVRCGTPGDGRCSRCTR